VLEAEKQGDTKWLIENGMATKDVGAMMLTQKS
jgi:hypothetical protein